MTSNELLQVSDEFLKQNSEYAKIKKSTKKGGPYSKNEKAARRNEVYRLHFEYGYPARKIAELMNVNRNTINGDIDYWYSKIIKKEEINNPEYLIVLNLEGMKVQMTRLREQLEKAKNNSERISIERLIYDINSKIINTYQKLASSVARTHELATQWCNYAMKKNGKSEQYISYFDTISVSKKAQHRIKKIIDEDRKRVN